MVTSYSEQHFLTDRLIDSATLPLLGGMHRFLLVNKGVNRALPGVSLIGGSNEFLVQAALSMIET